MFVIDSQFSFSVIAMTEKKYIEFFSSSILVEDSTRHSHDVGLERKKRGGEREKHKFCYSLKKNKKYIYIKVEAQKSKLLFVYSFWKT